MVEERTDGQLSYLHRLVRVHYFIQLHRAWGPTVGLGTYRRLVMLLPLLLLLLILLIE